MSMLSFPDRLENQPKCQVTHDIIKHVDPKQPPTKRKPFGAILSHGFISKVDLILPEEVYHIIEKELGGEELAPKWSRVIMPLTGIVEGAFFDEYIKKGNILMLSEGRVGVDNVYELREGILTLHLNKESYERAGIVGKPEGAKGKRGTKPWWVVEINLRLPSMFHGKSGFDRIVYAFKNFLNEPVTWLFHDLAKDSLMPDPMDVYCPTRKVASPQITRDIQVKMPSLQPPTEPDPLYKDDFQDYVEDILEWLSLVSLESPRVHPNDKVDPFISRYCPPGDTFTNQKLVKVTWKGFISSKWANAVFVKILLLIPKEDWFSYDVVGFGYGSSGQSKSCTVLRLPETANEFVLWEVV